MELSEKQKQFAHMAKLDKCYTALNELESNKLNLIALELYECVTPLNQCISLTRAAIIDLESEIKWVKSESPAEE